jgi:hypothetical protein
MKEASTSTAAARTSSSPRPLLRLFVSIASIPQRIHLVDKTVRSLAQQTWPPERILLVLPHTYRRWPSLSANVSRVHAHPLLETIRCERDDGPGTKVLCALPRVLELLDSSAAGEDGVPSYMYHAKGQRAHPHAHRRVSGGTAGSGSAALVLADDDREYQSHALSLIASSAVPLHETSASSGARALSFLTYRLSNSGGYEPRSGVLVSNLTVGQGADLFALPIGPIARAGNIRAYFELACEVDASFLYHDDVWLSSYLQDVAGVSVCPVTVYTAGNPHQNATGPSAAAGTSSAGTTGRYHKAPPSFRGSVHNHQHEVWTTSLRRLGGNATRSALNKRLGSKRLTLRRLAQERGLVTSVDSLRGALTPCLE